MFDNDWQQVTRFLERWEFDGLEPFPVRDWEPPAAFREGVDAACTRDTCARQLDLARRVDNVIPLLTGTTTAFCGPVAFIGVLVPHLARMAMDSSEHRVLLPATALLGAMAALAAGVLAQLPGSQAVLPLNAVTALIGSPVIIGFILHRKNLQRTNGRVAERNNCTRWRRILVRHQRYIRR